MTLRTVLLSLQALLAAAEPDDPQDAVVATQYKENHEMFLLTARHWTNAYANGEWYWPILCVTKLIFKLFFLGPHKNVDFDNKIQRLRDMGVATDDARAALSRHNWDLSRATEQLFS